MLPSGSRLALLAAFAAGGALAWPRLPDAVPADAPPEVFSAERARAHIRAWAAAPRPTGSAAHAAVLDAIEGELRALGFEVEREGFARLTNLVAHPPGGPRTGGVWLVAHTDTAPGAPGAADDGLGLGVAVEAARALSRDGVPEGLHLLLTDAEEVGLVGAHAHVANAWSEAPRLVVNVEARGTEGPAYMFQLAGRSAPLLDAWRAAGCDAQATSLARTVYAALPNDTDFTPFRGAGWWGYDFALIGGAWRYHTPDDTADNLDPRSVQHVGDCVLGLARAWLGRPLPGADAVATEAAPVYFQALGTTVVLPSWAVRALGAAALLAFPWRRMRGVLAGVGAWALALVLAGLGGYGLFRVALLARADFWDRPAEMVGPGPWYAAAAVLGVLAAVATARLGRQGVGWHLAGVVVSAGAAIAVPTAGYALVPGAWAAVLLARGRPGGAALATVATGIVTVPVLYAIFPALTTRMLPILPVVPLVLLAPLLGPAGAPTSREGRSPDPAAPPAGPPPRGPTGA